MPAPRIQLAIGPGTGSAPTQVVTSLSNGNVKDSLAGGPSLSFTMPGRSPAALASDGLATDVWVYKSGVLWQRCRMLPISQTWGADGADDVTVNAVGYRRLIEARYLVSGPPTFTGIDQGEIIWQFVAHTQGQTGGSLGITQGTTTTGVTRDRSEYKIGDSIGKLATDMGNVINGCWWGIGPTKVMTAKLWTAFPARLQRLVHGMNARNMTREPGAGFANAAGAVGSATDTVPVWVADAGIATDPRGRWEVFDSSHGSVTVQATVTDYANGLLQERAYPRSIWTIDLEPASYFGGDSQYVVGDLVTLLVPRSAVNEIGIPPVHVVVQISEVSVSFDDAGSTSVALAAVEQGIAP